MVWAGGGAGGRAGVECDGGAGVAGAGARALEAGTEGTAWAVFVPKARRVEMEWESHEYEKRARRGLSERGLSQALRVQEMECWGGRECARGAAHAGETGSGEAA